MFHKNIFKYIDEVSEKIEDQSTMGMDEQFINPMGKHIKNKPKPIGEGTGKMKDISTLDVSALEKMFLSNWNAFRRKLEMGKEIKRMF